MKIIWQLCLAFVLLWLFINIVERSYESPTPTEAAQAEAAGCKATDITISDLRARKQIGDYVAITGIITHNCSTPVGVQVKVTSLDRNGSVIDVADIWPASTNNIAPNDPFPFKWLDSIPGFSNFRVSVLDTRAWKR